ncbi:MAG: hypothetical protein SGI74_14870 [Oligoflexia bacterium]|nr:hypothetical protein [Oligoflexia bacterium]
MSKTILQKTYPGQIARPSVEAVYFHNENLAMITTPWGAKDASTQLCQMVQNYYGSTLTDPDATSAYARLPGLSPVANSLRGAILLANEGLFDKFNKTIYTSACEALFIGFNKSEVCWVQVGQPHLLLLRDGKLLTLESAIDLNLDYPNQSPLPSKLLGVERQIEIQTKNLVTQNGDILIMLARTHVPCDFFVENLMNQSGAQVLEILFNIAVAKENDVPFWISTISL